MLEAVRTGLGLPTQRATCDECGCQKDIRARMNDGGPRQARRKLQKHGWSSTSRGELCPTCWRRKKVALELIKVPDPAKANGQDLRQPSREQKRQIMGLLEVAYDVDAQRYKGTDTDVTLAEAIGDGVLPGWVAQLRDEFFGPAGSEELDAIEAEIRDELNEFRASVTALHLQIADGEKAVAEMKGAVAAANVKMQEAGRMLARVEAMKKAIGPRAKGI